MHSFQPSRGRILFEVFCALAVVASMVGAWQQTQASALLTAAAAAGLYAMVRLFDLGRNAPVPAEEPQRIEFEAAAEDMLPVVPAEDVPAAPVEPVPVLEARSELPEPVAPAPRASAGRRKGGSRKGSGRRTGARKAAEVIELVPAEEAISVPEDVADLAPPEEAQFSEPRQPEEPVAEEHDFSAEPAHIPQAPLFEPEPFVRMPRQAFGRRGRI